jgi:hypothetical protein
MGEESAAPSCVGLAMTVAIIVIPNGLETNLINMLSLRGAQRRSNPKEVSVNNDIYTFSFACALFHNDFPAVKANKHPPARKNNNRKMIDMLVK